jgi:hypothetical protein
MIQLINPSVPDSFGLVVNVLTGFGIQTAVLNGTDNSGQYGNITFTSGPWNGQSCQFPFAPQPF